MNYLNLERFSRFAEWWIVGVLFTITLLAAGLVTLSFTAFFEPIREEFGWSYAQISAAASIRGVEVGLLAPLVGILVDRWGPRPLVFGGILAIGCGLILLSITHSLSIYYLSFVIIAIGMSGPSVTVASATLANWFPKRFGIVMGINGSGVALGGLLVPMVVKIIEATGWRTAFLILGISIMATCLPLSLPLRFRTVKHSLQPDVEKSQDTPVDQASVPVIKHDMSMTLKQALLSRTFWHIAVLMIVSQLVIGTVMTHIMPYLSTLDFSRSTASLVVSAPMLISIASRISSGWFADRYNPKIVAVGSLAILWMGIICLNLISSEFTWMIVPYFILYGIGWGGIITMRAPLVREYFGRTHYGSIFGFMQGIGVVSLLGPVFAGWIFDTWNSYQITWQIYMILIFIAIIVVFTIPTSRNRLENMQASSSS